MIKLNRLACRTPGFRRAAVTLLAVTLLAAAGCANANKTIVKPNAAFYEKVLLDLSDERMEGRGPGTAGLDRARDYLAFHFKRMELEPAFGDSYTQQLDIPLGKVATVQTLTVTVGDAAEALALKSSEQFNALGLSTNGSFEGEAVFVGYGVSNEQHDFDSYNGLDEATVKGKVAIAFRHAPMKEDGEYLWTKNEARRAGGFTVKARKAEANGAVALVVVDPPSKPLEGMLHNSLSTRPRGKAIGIPVYHLSLEGLERVLRASGQNPYTTLDEWQKAADAGQPVPATLGDIRISGKVKLKDERADIDNVAAILPGRGDLKDEVVLIGAHYDHLGHGEFGSRSGGIIDVHCGADDNASGTAGVLLLAQRFVNQRHSGNAPENQRTLVFTGFSGEERGLLGSAYMVKHFDQVDVKLEQIVAMLNMDMIGRIEENKLSIFGTTTGSTWTALVRRANEPVGFNLELSDRAFGGSDHTSFIRKKIPSLHFFSGFHADYHTHHDTADKINNADAVRIIDLMENLINEMNLEPQQMVFTGKVKVDPHAGAKLPKAGDSSGERPRLGIMPGYDSDEGCEVKDVFEGTPAAEAGVKEGDLIIGWNGKVVGDVEDLTEQLNSSKPDDKIKLKIKRKDEVLEIEVTLGTR